MNPNQSKYVLVAFELSEALRDVVSGITNYAKQNHRNWQVLCVNAPEFATNFGGHRCDGAITLVRRESTGLMNRLRRVPKPVVNLLGNLHPELPSVLTDDIAVGRKGADYLRGLGFRKMAFLAVDAFWSRDRLTGFADALRAANLPPPVVSREYVADDFRFTSKARIHGTIARWVRTLGPRVAIMAPNDLVGRTLLNICQAQGIEVPQDVAILGVDNFLTLCEVSPIPLSSIAQDFPRIGFEAARLLDQMMCQKTKTTPSPVFVPPGRLFARASSNVWAFDDPIISQTLQAIHEHAATGITMGELLKLIPLSRKWLDHRFKQSLGHTPTEEIRRCRLRYVRDLLVETEMPLRQITAHCRFPFPENLIRSFKTAYGMSPYAYRLLHRSIPNGAPRQFSKL